MKKTKIPRKKVRGKNMKRLFACLLSLSMIPANGVAVFAAQEQAKAASTQKSAKVKTQVEDTQETSVKFAQDSLTTTIGHFQKFRFENIDINDISDVTYKVADQNILKITANSIYDNSTEYEAHSVEYVPEGQKAGETTVTATITKRDGTKIVVGPETFTVKGQEDSNVVPIKSYGLYKALFNEDYKSVDENNDGMIQKSEVKNISKVDFTYISGSRAFDNDELNFLKNATECKKLDFGGDSKLTNIDFVSNMSKLEEVSLRGTGITTIGTALDSVKDQLEFLNLADTKIPLTERMQYIRTKEANVVESSKKINIIEPAGVLNENDQKNITIGDEKLASYGFVSGNHSCKELYILASDNIEGKSTNIEIKDGDVTKNIKINFTKKGDTTPSLAQKSITTTMSCFPKIECKNVDDDTWVEAISSDTSIIRIVDDGDPWDEDGRKEAIYLEPQKTGNAEIKIQFHCYNRGETYYDTLKVKIDSIEDGTVPLTSFNEYYGLLDKDYNHVDKNRDYKIDENEIKDVDKIYTHSSDMTNESLVGLEKAVNCTSFSTSCGEITNIEFLKNYPKLKEVDLAYSGVKDISALNEIKDQLTELDLNGTGVSINQRFSFIKTNEITLEEGSKIVNPICPSGITTYSDTIKVEDEKVAKMEEEYLEDEEYSEDVLVAKGKVGDTTKIIITNGNNKVEIPVKIIAKSGNPSKPDTPTTEEPKPTEPTKPTTEEPTPTQPTTAAPQKVEKIIVTAPSNKLSAGKKVKLTANISNDASNKNVTWTTSNKKYATVDKNGVVKFNKKAAGKTVTITAYATDGSGKKATFKIKIMKGTVKKIKITGKKTVKAGKTLSLKAKVTASKGANKKLKWTSSNTKYATVSGSGKVKALKAGKKKSVKITAMATDGSGKKATVTIKIK